MQGNGENPLLWLWLWVEVQEKQRLQSFAHTKACAAWEGEEQTAALDRSPAVSSESGQPLH